MKLSDPLQMLKGVGPKNAEALESAGLVTVADFIDYWPRRYEDYTSSLSIADMKPGLVSIKGHFTSIHSRRSRRGLHMTEALLNDASGSVKIVWFNQPYRAASIKTGELYFVTGEFALKGRSLGITNPRVELAKDISPKDLLVPVYRENKRLNSLLLRKIAVKVESAFALIPETLPEWLIEKEDLMLRGDALKALHVPSGPDELAEAKLRLGFEEVFQMQLAGLLAKNELMHESAPKISFEESIAKDFVSHLPFELTPDQRKTVWQVYKDMSGNNLHVMNSDGVRGSYEQQTEPYNEYGEGVAESMTKQSALKSSKSAGFAGGSTALVHGVQPMNRLVEGDVGSGKTVVAAMAAVMAMKAGYQVLFMAPTEILARQHAESLAKLLAHTEWASQIGLLVGSLTPKQKSNLHARIASGDCRLAVGTNALVQDKVVTENVGLVVIDEQHRFGVEQRTKLRTKSGLFPHVLCMTATPIPRTLALTLYGELDITQLASMPNGRKPIDTEVILPTARAGLYKTIDKHIEEGRQAFFVCPLIEHNPDLGLVSAEELYEKLSKNHFKHRTVGLLHGNMKAEQKDRIMSDFKAKKIDILVSTTVIEVGVDVPNATVMVVESAERFGLAQIHQLRGRVGRGEHQGFCFLVPTDETAMSKRLQVLSYVTDGFRLSEIDLELRGPGAIYGLRQSGALDLRIAELSDEKLISRAKRAAQDFVNRGESVVKYKVLAERVAHFRSISKLN